jgi:hypothetical protein
MTKVRYLHSFCCGNVLRPSRVELSGQLLFLFFLDCAFPWLPSC